MSATATAVKERPILFSAPMVRAILDGKKTQTRRVINPGPHRKIDTVEGVNVFASSIGGIVLGVPSGGLSRSMQDVMLKCPYGVPGDRLWVRETFMWKKGADIRESYIGTYQEASLGDPPHFAYRADDGAAEAMKGFKWKPSIFMRRHASRITLEVTGVRVERLQQISEADAIAEGLTKWEGSEPCPSSLNGVKSIPYYGIALADAWETDPRKTYKRLWETINGEESWKANPWVWVVEFQRVN